MSGFEIGILVYLAIGIVIETIALILHRKYCGTWLFDDETIQVKFISGVVAWPFVFPQVAHDYIKWNRSCLRNLATSGYVFDLETCGLDGKPRIFVGKKVFKPSIQFHPFKISLYKIIEISEAETDDLLNRTLDKYV